MHIVFLQDDFPPLSLGGAGFSVYELACGMKKAGHKVSVITTCRKKEEEGELEFEGLRVYRIQSHYPERLRGYISLNNAPVVRKVKSILCKIQPDIVHINNVHFYLSYRSFAVSKKYAKAVIFTARDVMSFSYAKLNTKKFFESGDAHLSLFDLFMQAKKRFNPLRNFFIRRSLRHADKIISVSNSLASALKSNNIACDAVVHTGSDVSLWESSTDEIEAFREKNKLTNKKIILFGGRISEAKGGETAIKALEKILKIFPNTTLLIMGAKDANVQRMIDTATNHNFGHAIHVTGWVERNEARIAYAASDVILVPSLCLDAFPRVVVEAMASAKPVVGTCYGGASEIIQDGVTGFVVNPLFPEEIAGAVIELLTDPEKAAHFGSAGYNRIRNEFSLEKMIEKYIMEYESAIESKKPQAVHFSYKANKS